MRKDTCYINLATESGPRMCAKAGAKQTPQSCPPQSAVARTPHTPLPLLRRGQLLANHKQSWLFSRVKERERTGCHRLDDSFVHGQPLRPLKDTSSELTLFMIIPLISSTDRSAFLQSLPSHTMALTFSKPGWEL